METDPEGAKLRAEAEEKGEAFLANAQEQIRSVAAKIQLDPRVLAKLLQFEKIIRVKIPLTLDEGGEPQMIDAWRIGHNGARGPYKGGIRYAIEVTEPTIKALATEMSIKNAIAGLPYGGGKGGVAINPQELSVKELARLTRGYVDQCLKQDPKAFGALLDVPAGDIGTTSREMGWFADEFLKVKRPDLFTSQDFFEKLAQADETGTPHLEYYMQHYYGQRSIDMNEGSPIATVTAKPEGKGGAVGRTPATGLGLFYVTREALKVYGERLGIGAGVEGQKVAVEAYGNVGSYAARSFRRDGASIMAIKEYVGGKNVAVAAMKDAGIDLDALDKHLAEKNSDGTSKKNTVLTYAALHPEDAREVTVDEFWSSDVTIMVLAAKQKTVDARIAKLIKAKIISEGANGPLEDAATEKILLDKGAIVLCDVFTNDGGVAFSSLEWRQNNIGELWPEVAGNGLMEDKVVSAFYDISRVSETQKISLREAAYQIAISQIVDAMLAADPKLWSLFSPVVIRAKPFDEAYPPYVMDAGAKRWRPETLPELNQINTPEKKLQLIEKADQVMNAKIEGIVTKALLELPAKRGSVILIGGPRASGKPMLAQSILKKIADQGFKAKSLDMDYQTVEEISRALQGKKIPVKNERGANGEVFQLDQDEILVVSGYDAIGDRILGIIKAMEGKAFPIMAYSSPDILLANNWALTAYDLRLMRDILSSVAVGEEANAQEVIRRWQWQRVSETEAVFGTWKNAKRSINTYLPYELPFLKSMVGPLIKNAIDQEKTDEYTRNVLRHLETLLKGVEGWDISLLDGHRDSVLWEYAHRYAPNGAIDVRSKVKARALVAKLAHEVSVQKAMNEFENKAWAYYHPGPKNDQTLAALQHAEFELAEAIVKTAGILGLRHFLEMKAGDQSAIAYLEYSLVDPLFRALNKNNETRSQLIAVSIFWQMTRSEARNDNLQDLALRGLVLFGVVFAAGIAVMAASMGYLSVVAQNPQKEALATSLVFGYYFFMAGFGGAGVYYFSRKFRSAEQVAQKNPKFSDFFTERLPEGVTVGDLKVGRYDIFLQLQDKSRIKIDVAGGATILHQLDAFVGTLGLSKNFSEVEKVDLYPRSEAREVEWTLAQGWPALYPVAGQNLERALRRVVEARGLSVRAAENMDIIATPKAAPGSAVSVRGIGNVDFKLSNIYELDSSNIRKIEFAWPFQNLIVPDLNGRTMTCDLIPDAQGEVAWKREDFSRAMGEYLRQWDNERGLISNQMSQPISRQVVIAGRKFGIRFVLTPPKGISFAVSRDDVVIASGILSARSEARDLADKVQVYEGPRTLNGAQLVDTIIAFMSEAFKERFHKANGMQVTYPHLFLNGEFRENTTMLWGPQNRDLLQEFLATQGIDLGAEVRYQLGLRREGDSINAHVFLNAIHSKDEQRYALAKEAVAQFALAAQNPVAPVEYYWIDFKTKEISYRFKANWSRRDKGTVPPRVRDLFGQIQSSVTVTLSAPAEILGDAASKAELAWMLSQLPRVVHALGSIQRLPHRSGGTLGIRWQKLGVHINGYSGSEMTDITVEPFETTDKKDLHTSFIPADEIAFGIPGAADQQSRSEARGIQTTGQRPGTAAKAFGLQSPVSSLQSANVVVMKDGGSPTHALAELVYAVARQGRGYVVQGEPSKEIFNSLYTRVKHGMDSVVLTQAQKQQIRDAVLAFVAGKTEETLNVTVQLSVRYLPNRSITIAPIVVQGRSEVRPLVKDGKILAWKSKHGKTLKEILDLFVKEYDFRGFDGADDVNFPQQVDEELLRWVGNALGSVNFESRRHGRSVQLKAGDTFVIAGDNGPSTQKFKDALIQGLRDAGINVIDLGVTISGHLYKNISNLGAQGGLYVTRSHVEVGTNGAKPNIGGITLYGEMLQQVKSQILSAQYAKAERPGTLDDSQAVRNQAREMYLGSLAAGYGHLAELLKSAGMKIAFNLNSGAATGYVSFLKDLFGENVTLLKSEGDSWATKGLADPTRMDEKALAHPEANMVQYSKDHPDVFVLNFDLDTDRVSLLQDGKLYLGDEMFYCVIEYMLTLDPYKEFLKKIYPDSRMKIEFGQLVRHFGGIAKLHPKGHSKVKATIDLLLSQLVKTGGFPDVAGLLKAYPGFRIAQSEYSLHFFLTSDKGEAFDDALEFALFWLNVFAKIKLEHKRTDWAYGDYVRDLKSTGIIKESIQIKEQRTAMPDDVKGPVMDRMKDSVLEHFKGRSDFAYAPDWEADYEAGMKPYTLINIEGVSHLLTPMGEIFWGQSNTSPKVAFGAQSTSAENTRKLAGIVAALMIHAREEVAPQAPKLHPLETSELFKAWLPETHKLSYADFSKTTEGASGKTYEAWQSNGLEANVLAAYPTAEAALSEFTARAEIRDLDNEASEFFIDDKKPAHEDKQPATIYYHTPKEMTSSPSYGVITFLSGIAVLFVVVGLIAGLVAVAKGMNNPIYGAGDPMARMILWTAGGVLIVAAVIAAWMWHGFSKQKNYEMMGPTTLKGPITPENQPYSFTEQPSKAPEKVGSPERSEARSSLRTERSREAAPVRAEMRNFESMIEKHLSSDFGMKVFWDVVWAEMNRNEGMNPLDPSRTFQQWVLEADHADELVDVVEATGEISLRLKKALDSQKNLAAQEESRRFKNKILFGGAAAAVILANVVFLKIISPGLALHFLSPAVSLLLLALLMPENIYIRKSLSLEDAVRRPKLIEHYSPLILTAFEQARKEMFRIVREESDERERHSPVLEAWVRQTRPDEVKRAEMRDIEADLAQIPEPLRTNVREFLTLGEADAEGWQGSKSLLMRCAKGSLFRFDLGVRTIANGSERWVKIDVTDITPGTDQKEVGFYKFRMGLPVGGKIVAIGEYDMDAERQQEHEPTMRVGPDYEGRYIGSALLVLGLYLAKKYGNESFIARDIVAKGFFDANHMGFSPNGNGWESIFDLVEMPLPKLPSLKPQDPIRVKLNREIAHWKNRYASIAGSKNREYGFNISVRRFEKIDLTMEKVYGDPLLNEEERVIVAKAIAFGKGGIFHFWKELDKAAKRRLLDQLNAIDRIDIRLNIQTSRTGIESLQELFQKFIINGEAGADLKPAPEQIQAPGMFDLADENSPQAMEAIMLGDAARSRGEVAVLELAGGSGSRLGFDKPKIEYPASPIRHKSLGRLRAEKIAAYAQDALRLGAFLTKVPHSGQEAEEMAAGLKKASAKTGIPIPWIIMTSDVTHAQTLAYFNDRMRDGKYFGLIPKDWVRFKEQRVLPVFTDRGEWVLEAKDKISVSGFGHGDAREWIMMDPETQEWLRGVFGIKYVAVANVDNAMLPALGSRAIGYHILATRDNALGAEPLSKVVVDKRGPGEKVGVSVLLDGNDAVIEYNQFTRDILTFKYAYVFENRRIVFYKADDGTYQIYGLSEFNDFVKGTQSLAAMDFKQFETWVSEHLANLNEVPQDAKIYWSGEPYLKERLKGLKLWLNLGSINGLIWTLDSFMNKEHPLAPLPVVVAKGKNVDGFHPENFKPYTKDQEVIKVNKFETMAFHGFLRGPSHGAHILARREDAFSPIKEPEKEGPDNPVEAARIYSERHIRWLRGRVDAEVMPGAVVELADPFAGVDGRELFQRIGKGLFLSEKSQFSVSGPNTRIGQNFRVENSSAFILRHDIESRSQSEVQIGPDVTVKAHVYFRLKGNATVLVDPGVVFNYPVAFVLDDGEYLHIRQELLDEVYRLLSSGNEADISQVFEMYRKSKEASKGKTEESRTDGQKKYDSFLVYKLVESISKRFPDFSPAKKNAQRVLAQIVDWQLKLKPEQKEALARAQDVYLEKYKEPMSPAYAAYVTAMILRADREKLKIAVRGSDGSVIGEQSNFVLASQLTDEEKERLLGAFDYKTIVADSENEPEAAKAFVTIHSLDGGLGEKLVRYVYKQILVDENLVPREEVEFDENGKVKNGAKGTDTGFVIHHEGQRVFVSVAEVKILQMIERVRTGKIGGVGFTPLVNKDSKPSYEKLLDRICLEDRFKSTGDKRTYRQLLQELGAEVNPLYLQQDLPGIDVETNRPATNPDGLWQPGGHGQLGFSFLYKPEDWKPRHDGKFDVLAFVNGDNVNASQLDPSMIGMMARKKMPVVKLTTMAMPIDKKGGKDGLLLENGSLRIPQQMEIADAQAWGKTEENLFIKAGQEEGSKIFGATSVGNQPFNTNTIYVVKDFLFPLLAEVKKLLGDERYYAEVIAPTLISKDTKKAKDGRNYRPLDAAIGTVIHNMNEFFLRRLAVPTGWRSIEDKKIAEVMKKYRYDRVLYFFNVPRRFFTPQKNPLDAYLQAYGNYFSLDQKVWILRETSEGLVPPEFSVTARQKAKPDDERGFSFDSGKGYWSELQNVIDSFGKNSDWSFLKKLDIDGDVLIRDAVLAGDIHIQSAFDGVFALDQAPEMQPLRGADGRIRLKNIKVSISKQGGVSVTPRSEMRTGNELERAIALSQLALSELKRDLKEAKKAGTLALIPGLEQTIRQKVNDIVRYQWTLSENTVVQEIVPEMMKKISEREMAVQKKDLNKAARLEVERAYYAIAPVAISMGVDPIGMLRFLYGMVPLSEDPNKKFMDIYAAFLTGDQDKIKASNLQIIGRPIKDLETAREIFAEKFAPWIAVLLELPKEKSAGVKVFALKNFLGNMTGFYFGNREKALLPEAGRLLTAWDNWVNPSRVLPVAPSMLQVGGLKVVVPNVSKTIPPQQRQSSARAEARDTEVDYSAIEESVQQLRFEGAEARRRTLLEKLVALSLGALYKPTQVELTPGALRELGKIFGKLPSELTQEWCFGLMLMVVSQGIPAKGEIYERPEVLITFVSEKYRLGAGKEIATDEALAKFIQAEQERISKEAAKIRVLEKRKNSSRSEIRGGDNGYTIESLTPREQLVRGQIKREMIERTASPKILWSQGELKNLKTLEIEALKIWTPRLYVSGKPDVQRAKATRDRLRENYYSYDVQVAAHMLKKMALELSYEEINEQLTREQLKEVTEVLSAAVHNGEYLQDHRVSSWGHYDQLKLIASSPAYLKDILRKLKALYEHEARLAASKTSRAEVRAVPAISQATVMNSMNREERPFDLRSVTQLSFLNYLKLRFGILPQAMAEALSKSFTNVRGIVNRLMTHAGIAAPAVASKTAESANAVKMKSARAVFGETTLNKTSDAFIIGATFAFDRWAIAAMRAVFGDASMVVLVRNDEDRAKLAKMNAELAKAGRPEILQAEDSNGVKAFMAQEKVRQRGIGRNLRFKAIVDVNDPMAIALKEMIPDFVWVNDGNFGSFMFQAGEAIRMLVADFQKNFALAKSA
ncbi:MAG: UTP--glucose-1-phosphate uridylyltransferase [Candidatus Omnitrophota bacterium]